jgi:hypothetical protein
MVQPHVNSTCPLCHQVYDLAILSQAGTITAQGVNEEMSKIREILLITWLIFLVLSFSASAWGLIYTFILLGKGYQTSTIFSVVVCSIGFSVILVLLIVCCDGRDFVESLWVLCKRNNRRADHVEMVDRAEIEEEIDGGEVEMVDDDADRDFRNEEGV